MITFVDACVGGLPLARHLADQAGNEEVRIVQAQGLIGSSIQDCMVELETLSNGTRAKRPLVHVISSPQFGLSDLQWDTYWTELEDEFGMAGHPFLEVEHLKFGLGGRTARHRHRLYLRIGLDGKAINLSHSAARAEKLSRIAEFAVGEPLVPGRFNRSVIATLRRQGRLDVAEFLESAGLGSTPRPVAVGRAERQQAERLEDLASDEIWKRAWLAWSRTSDGTGFTKSLADAGLTLAAGDKGPVIISPGGAVTSLRRAVTNGAAQARESRVRKCEIDARLVGHILPDLATAQAQPLSSLEKRTNSTVGSDRRPVPSPATSESVVSYHLSERAYGLVAAVVPVDDKPMRLTSVQQEALSKFSDVLAGGAARLARQLWRVAELAARSRIEHLRAKAERKRLHDQRARHALEVVRVIFAMASDPSSPAVGPVSWRESVKAEIANLPELGQTIRWVQREEAGQRAIHLTTGEIVRTSTRSATSTGESPASTTIIVAHAKRAGWETVELSGGSAEWRRSAARQMTRAGLKVSNPELHAVARDEAKRIDGPKRLVALWEVARSMTSEAPDDQFVRKRFVKILRLCREEPLVRELMIRSQRAVLDRDLVELSKREWLLAETGFEVHEFEDYALGRSAKKVDNRATEPQVSARDVQVVL